MKILREVELLCTELHHVVVKLQVASNVPLLPELQVGFIGEETGCFFGDFSPHALRATTQSVHGKAVITDVVSPVLQIMHELHEFCGKSFMVLSMGLVSLKSSAMAMMPSPPPSESYHPIIVVDCGGLVGSVTLSSMAIGHVASLSGEADETGVLPPNSEALSCDQLETSESIVSVALVVDDLEVIGVLASDPLEPSQSLAFVEPRGFDVIVTHSHKTTGQVSLRAKVDEIFFKIEVHSLLKHLEVPSPGSGKAIVEEALKRNEKKSGATKKRVRLLDQWSSVFWVVLMAWLAFADLVAHVIFGRVTIVKVVLPVGSDCGANHMFMGFMLCE
ncbi:Gibberellin 2-beta-dioxygenase 8 [Hordeum vulgare]|nr:Gibberellin 2-beta-dioxygenase 8 [Hordeum vulgare]